MSLSLVVLHVTAGVLVVTEGYNKVHRFDGHIDVVVVRQPFGRQTMYTALSSFTLLYCSTLVPSRVHY